MRALISLHLLASPWLERLGWTLLHFLWQGALAAALLALVLAGLRRRSARTRYWVCIATTAATGILPLITFWSLPSHSPMATRIAPIGSHKTAPNVNPTTPVLRTTLALNRTDQAAENNFSLKPPNQHLPSSARTMPSAREAWGTLLAAIQSLLPWCAAVWTAGVTLLSLRLLMGWMQAQRLCRQEVRPAAQPWPARLESLARRMRVRLPVRLLESTLAEVPAVIGWLRPVILLPISALAGLSAAQIEMILAHELAHVRRQDYLVNLGLNLFETLGFYHPAVWWMARCARTERECACDDLAVAACGGDRLGYVEALTTLEEQRVPVGQFALAANGGGRGPLLVRVRRLLGVEPRPLPYPGRLTWGMAGIIALGAVGILAVGGGSLTRARAQTADRAPVAQAAALTNADAPNRFETQIDPSGSSNFSLAFFRLWLPPARGRLAGVLAVLPAGGAQGVSLADDPLWQALAARWNYALLGVTFTPADYNKPYYPAEGGSGQALLDALGQFAKVSGHPELDNAPVAMIGHATGGQFACQFACWKPERTAVFAALKAGTFKAKPDDDAARAVPGLFIAGEKDEERRVKNARQTFLDNQTPACRWAYALEPRAGNELAHSLDLTIPFFDAVISGRLQPWRGDVQTNRSQPMEAAALGAWLPNSEVASAWSSFIAGYRGLNYSSNLQIPGDGPPRVAQVAAVGPHLGNVRDGAPPPPPETHLVSRLEMSGPLWDSVRAFSRRNYLTVAVERRGDDFLVTAQPVASLPVLGVVRDTVELRFAYRGALVPGGEQIDVAWNHGRDGLSVSPSYLYLGAYAKAAEGTLQVTASDGKRLAIRQVRVASGPPAQVEILDQTDSSAVIRCALTGPAKEGPQIGSLSIELAEPAGAEISVPFFGYCKPERASK